MEHIGLSLGVKRFVKKIIVIAKLGPKFSFSWTEMVFDLNLAPPIHPKRSMKMGKKLSNSKGLST